MKNSILKALAWLFVTSLITSSCAYWKTIGNEGTNPSTDFIGTTDNADLAVKTDNTEKLRVTTDGKVGIGTATPQSPLHIKTSSGTHDTPTGADIIRPNLTIEEPNSNYTVIKMQSTLNYKDNSNAWFIRSMNNWGKDDQGGNDNLIIYDKRAGEEHNGFFFLKKNAVTLITDGSDYGPSQPDGSAWPPPQISYPPSWGGAQLGVWPTNAQLTIYKDSKAPATQFQHPEALPGHPYLDDLWFDQPQLKLIQHGDDYTRITLTNQDAAHNIDLNFWAIRSYNNRDSTKEKFIIYNWQHGQALLTITGNHNVGIGTSEPQSKLQVTNGDIYIETSDKGIILKSPDGHCWKITVDNAGNIIRTSIVCH